MNSDIGIVIGRWKLKNDTVASVSSQYFNIVHLLSIPLKHHSKYQTFLKLSELEIKSKGDSRYIKQNSLSR